MEEASERSHHCVDSLAWPISSEIGGVIRVSSHLDSAPLPPRTCSDLARLEIRFGSATGIISEMVGCSRDISKGVIDSCIDSDLMLSIENESVPCPVVHNSCSQNPTGVLTRGVSLSWRGKPEFLNNLDHLLMLF